MSRRPSLLPISERCGLAAVLHDSDPTASGLAANIGRAYHAIASGDQTEASRLLDLLTERDREELAALAVPTDVPPFAIRERRLGLSPTGGVTVPGTIEKPNPESLIEGSPDAYWMIQRVVRVGDYKTGERDNRDGIEDGPRSLQLAAYGFMAAAATGADAMDLGIWYARRGAWDWSGAIYLDSPEAGDLWRRVVVAATKEPKADVGPHCETCWQRSRCPARLLPAIDGTALGELEPFQGGTELTPDRAEVGLRLISAMREVADRAEEHIRAEVTAGRLHLERDGKVYGPSEVAGRRSASVEELVKAGLTQYVRQGKPYLRWQWRKK